MLFTIFQQKLAVNKGYNNSCGKCRQLLNFLKKWDKQLATGLAILIFLVVFCIVLYNSTSTDSTIIECGESSDGGIETDNVTDGSQRTTNRCSALDTCLISCSYASSSQLVSDINWATNGTSCETIELILSGCNFTNGAISRGWLNITSPISALTIENSNLEDVEHRALVDHPFEKLDTLVIESSRITTLKKHYFVDMKLSAFHFRFDVYTQGITAEATALEGLNATLKVLQVSNCLSDSQAIQNLTGTYGSYFRKLETVTFSDNKLYELTNHSFIKAPTLKTLHLERNELMEIEVDGFSPLTSLEILQISDNQLTRIPEGLFKSLIGLKQLYSGGNPWVCECSLQWFKDFLFYGTVSSDNSTMCSNGTYFDDTDFGCPIVTTISASTTTTTANSEDIVTISCRNLQLAPIFVSDHVRKTHFQTASVINQSVTLDIFDLNTFPPSFEIIVYGSLLDYHMFWHNVNNLSDYGCVSHIQDCVVMENLQRKNSYTLCVIVSGQTMASPYDCLGFTVPHEWNHQTWIPKTMIGIVIGGLIALLLLVIVITAICVFYILRQNPKLLAGNKRVVIVGKKTVEAMVMPSTYNKSCPANCAASYLTPNNNIFEKRRHMLRSMSECSVYSTPGSYITAEVQADIHEFYSRQGAVRRYYQNRDETIAVDEHIYEKPPVPPGHPSEMRDKRL